MSNHGIINYPDAQAVQKQLDELIKKPIYSISPEALKKYEAEYFDGKCAKSKAMIEEAKQVISEKGGFITPPPQDDSWFYGAGTVAIGMAVTKSKFSHGAPDELSFYSPECCWGEGAARIRRYHIRMDGFVSLHFAATGGELTTPRFTFTGGRLSLNIATGAFGNFTAEFRDENGTPIPGYTFADSLPEIGDDIEMIARWKQCGPDVRPLEGKTVQLAIRAKNADLYSLAFVPYQDDPELPPYK